MLTMRRTLMHTRISDTGAAITDDTAVITAAAIILATRTEPIGAGTDTEMGMATEAAMGTTAAMGIGAGMREAMDTEAVMLRGPGLVAHSTAWALDTRAVTRVAAGAEEAEGSFRVWRIYVPPRCKVKDFATSGWSGQSVAASLPSRTAASLITRSFRSTAATVFGS